MPIRPIDLQTMLMQLNQVGREQAVEKEGAALQSAMKGAADQKRLDESKESVHRAEDAEGGPRPIADSAGKPPQGEEAGKEAATEGKEGREAKEEIIKDPDLGTKIDLTG